VTELHLPDPPLQDDVILLGPWAEEDLPVRMRAFADPVLQRFSWPDTTGLTVERQATP
jgi:hypothetical protein